MRNVILIAGSFSSANFNVMLSFIRAAGNDLIIHAVATSNENPSLLPQYSDVVYHALTDKRRMRLNRKTTGRWQLFKKRILHHITANIDNFIPPKFEGTLYNECELIIIHNPVVAIFSVCLPIQAHRCAIKLVLKHPELRLIPFWLDPFSNSPIKHDRLWGVGARRLERKIFSTVPQIFAFGGALNNNQVIGPWKDKLVEVHIPYVKNRKINTSNQQIIFAGGFLKGVREPEPVLNNLLGVVKEIKNLTFHFYVRNPDDFRDYVEQSDHKIEFHSFVNRDILEGILSSAYMLLSVGNLTDEQIPSKTIEYVSYRKPIIHFAGIDNDTSLIYLNDYPDKCIIDTRKNIKDNVEKLVLFLRSMHKEVTWDELMEVPLYRQCTPEYINNIIRL